MLLRPVLAELLDLLRLERIEQDLFRSARGYELTLTQDDGPSGR